MANVSMTELDPFSDVFIHGQWPTWFKRMDLVKRANKDLFKACIEIAKRDVRGRRDGHLGCTFMVNFDKDFRTFCKEKIIYFPLLVGKYIMENPWRGVDKREIVAEKPLNHPVVIFERLYRLVIKGSFDAYKSEKFVIEFKVDCDDSMMAQIITPVERQWGYDVLVTGKKEKPFYHYRETY